MEQSQSALSRRQFIKLAGAGLGAMVLQTACNPSPATQKNSPQKTSTAQSNTLTIMQWGHFVPAFKDWFDQYAAAWGKENGAQVTIDYIGLSDSYIKASGEVALQTGHDLIWHSSSPAAFEAEVVDLSDLVTDLEGRVGPMVSLARQSCYNPKSNKYYGLPDFWTPGPLIWRKDQWEAAEAGAEPKTWEDLLRVGRKLKQNGCPLGVGIAAELDSNTALRGALFSYGASVQDADSNVVINSSQTVEAVTMMSRLFKEAMTPEVLGWSSSSNNQFLASGAGSVVFNALSAVRAIEKAAPDLAANLLLSPPPVGPVRQLAPANVIGVYTIWKFARNIDLARKFLVDLILNYDTAFQKSELYNFPAFPGAVTDFKGALAADPVANPPGKYSALANADQWSTNFGYPGIDNAASNEVMSLYLIPKMFALAATDRMSAADAVKWATAEITAVYEKWRKKGFI